MNKKTKVIVSMMIFILIMIIVCLLLIIKLKKNLIKEEKDEYKDISYKYDIETSLKYVNDRSEYFTISSIVDNYINLIGNENDIKLFNIISPQYVKEYNVTNENILRILKIPKTDNMYQYYNCIINDMLVAQLDSETSVYIVNGKCRIVGKDTIFDINIMLEVNTVNKIYNLYPGQYIVDKKLNELKIGDQITNNYKKEDINDRNNNNFTYVNLTDNEMASKYMENLKELLLYYKDSAYDKLNTEYSKLRFKDEEEFREYLTDTKSKIQLMQLSKYKVEANNNYTDYICSDRYNNYYIFREKDGIMRYSVLLDSYTISLPSALEKYSSSSTIEKVGYNIQKCVEAINNKDYSYVYNKLDESFKTNKYNTENIFEKAIRNNLFDNNVIEKASKLNEGDTYIYEVVIKNGSNEEQKKNVTIIMQIGEGTDYTMSFSFK